VEGTFVGHCTSTKDSFQARNTECTSLTYHKRVGIFEKNSSKREGARLGGFSASSHSVASLIIVGPLELTQRNSSRKRTMLTANSTSNSAARLSQYNESLQDAGPVPKQSSHSRPSRQSSLLSMKSTDSGEPSPAFITAFGDLRPNRDSMVSLQEAEYGWAGSASAVTAATKANRKVQPAPKPG
jgi:hypothetical protein